MILKKFRYCSRYNKMCNDISDYLCCESKKRGHCVDRALEYPKPKRVIIRKKQIPL